MIRTATKIVVYSTDDGKNVKTTYRRISGLGESCGILLAFYGCYKLIQRFFGDKEKENKDETE